MNILIVCPPPLLDNSLEQINDLKKRVNLHVLIPVSLHTPNHTVFKLKNVSSVNSGIYSYNKIRFNIENTNIFDEYLDGCKSVHFVFFAPKKGINILTTNLKILKLIKEMSPDIIHFDDLSGRLYVLALLLRKRKIIANIHDPKLHSGEEDFIHHIIRKFIFGKISAFSTFSLHSKGLFDNIFHSRIPCLALKLPPYHLYTKVDRVIIPDIEKREGDTIFLFFGRISKYKGIDELLDAFSNLIKITNNIKLIVAGTGNYKYVIPPNLENSKSLIIINKFISVGEMKFLFEISDCLICPYRDATQSGVLMTADAFKLSTIVSNVGSFSEYIEEGENGSIYNIDNENELTNAIISFLKNKPTFKSNNDLNSKMNSLKLIDLYTKIASENKK